MLNVTVTKDKVKVARSSFSSCSNINMVATGKLQERWQQSPSSILVPSAASDGSGSRRLMSQQQTNEYYFKYSRNRCCVCSRRSRRNGVQEPCAFLRCLCRRCCQRQHSFRRTIITNDLQKMKRERQLLVKLKMGKQQQAHNEQYEQPFNSDGCRRQCGSKTCCCYPRAICSNSDSCKSCNDNHTTCREGGGYYCCCCPTTDDKTRFGSCSSISYMNDDSVDSRVTITNMIQNSSNGLSETYSSTLSAITTTTTTSTSTIFNTAIAKTSSSSFLPSSFSTCSFSHPQESFSSKFHTCNTILPLLSSLRDENTANKMSLPNRDLLPEPHNTSSTFSSSSCLLPINPRCFSSYPSKLVHVLLSFLTVIVTSLWNKVNMKYTVLNNVLIKHSPASSLLVYFLKTQRHLSSSVSRGRSRVTTIGKHGITTTPTSTTNPANCSVISASAGVGHRFRSCQITREKSDLIYIIALGLCLLSPSVTPVITSNAIFPMDSAAHADRDMDGELSILVEGVVGKRVEMPCDITPSRRDDTVYMVLWFRGEESIPIYSLDVRGKHVGGGKPWSAERPFGKRAYFQSTSEPARLIVEGAKISDQGIYRCRVDFRNSPSREARLNLTITVPPNEPQIYDNTGMSIRGEVGPYLEGSNVELTCIVRDGVPSPMVQWYLNDELVDSSYHVKNDKEVINHIPVSNIQRSHHRASLSCRASNTLLVPPVTKTVYFELNLRPLSVSIPIKHRNPQLTADTQYEIKCESWGSHPPPVMTWWLDGREEKGAAIEESRGSNNSVSRLFFTPNASNDGQVLTCRAENPQVTAGALEDSWRLRVVYPPMLSLRMGSSLNPRDIKEGDDVYFECHIRANPQVHKLAWFHNGFLLHHNRSAGVILSNQSLVLQKVSRPSAGNYSCRASNVQGEGTSNHVLLDIMYAPACQTDLSGTDAPIIIAASRSEDVNITCEMDALPDRLKFQWTHTNTVGENSELEPDMYTSVGSKSLLRYHLRSEEDFGTLLCWAHNSIGNAERPCVYQLVPAVGMHGCWFLFAGVGFAGAIFVMAVLPETKGKSFDEIMEIMKAYNH